MNESTIQVHVYIFIFKNSNIIRFKKYIIVRRNIGVKCCKSGMPIKLTFGRSVTLHHLWTFGLLALLSHTNTILIMLIGAC